MRGQASVDRAFTLVELLIVIGIIALLIGMVLPAMTRVRKTAINVECASNLRQMGNAIVMYASEHDQRLPYVLEPVWKSDGTLDFDSANPMTSPLSMRSVLQRYLPGGDNVYVCRAATLGYPRQSMAMTYRISSANNFDGQPRTVDQLMTPTGPRYEYSLKYLNGRVFKQLYIDSAVYPFKLEKGAGPFYLVRDFVVQNSGGEFLPPHPVKRYNQLRLDMSVTSEKDPRFAFTSP
jgi:prepilin-type N-terminal cleavage/methylation domain-containing protein